MIRQGAAEVIIAVLMLTACAQTPATSLPPTAAQGQSEVCDVAEFYAETSLLSVEAGQKILQARADNPCDQLRQAVLLSKPGTAFFDNAQAGRLLRGFLHNPNHARHPDRGFASLLADTVDERRKAQAALQIQHNLKESLAQEQLISQTLGQKLEWEHSAKKSLRKQLKALQSQLDRLKSIEQDINEKEQSVAAPTTDSETDEPNQDTAD